MTIATTAVAALAAKGISASINIIIAVMGFQAANRIMDEIRAKMVAEERGPTDDELDAVFARLDARSERIQSS